MTHMGYILNGNELRSGGMIRIKLREIAQKKVSVRESFHGGLMSI